MLALSWRRLTEWLAMAVLLLALIATFVHYSHYVRGQAELAAVKTTLGALRTALVVEHLRQQLLARQEPELPMDFNPFKLLAQTPATYIGVMSHAQSQGATPGVWVYAPECPCVGYRPQDALWLDSPVYDSLIWFEVTGIPGVLQLKAREKYRWNNELID